MDIFILEDLKKEMKDSLVNTINIYKNMFEDDKIENLQLNIEEEKIIQNLNNFEKVINRIEAKLNDYKEIMKSSDPTDESKLEVTKLNKSLQKIEKQKLGKETSKFLEFTKSNKQENKLQESDKEDFIVENVVETYKCPITTVRLVNPMKSKICNHRYSEDAINELLKRKNKPIKCPAFGCGSKLSKKDLVIDSEIKAFLLKNPNL